MTLSDGTIFERFGVPTIVNARGPWTRLSGALMDPQVAAAMVEASRSCVDIVDLQARASEIIAEVTGAEAGLVTAGAAAGLMLGTAACLAGLDPTRMERLPDTTGMANEVLVPVGHRTVYDRSVRTAGARLIEVEADAIEGAIGQRTAALLYLAAPDQVPPLADVVALAHARDVPVLVDSASQLPPKENLRRFIAEGVDLVVFSGGKGLRGPQSSGILSGRHHLIASAALQMFDWDLLFEQFDPPPGFIDVSRLPGLPHHGIGRPCKVGKEEIVGLLVALRLFVEGEDAARTADWGDLAKRLHAALDGIAHTRVDLIPHSYKQTVPGVRLTLDERGADMSAIDLVQRLEQGAPSIRVNAEEAHAGRIVLAPICLRAEDVSAIERRLRDVLE